MDSTNWNRINRVPPVVHSSLIFNILDAKHEKIILVLKGNHYRRTIAVMGFTPRKVLPTNSLEWWPHSPIHPPQNYRIPSISSNWIDSTARCGDVYLDFFCFCQGTIIWKKIEKILPERIYNSHYGNRVQCRQCLPLSVVQLKGKHCRKPHCRNGVVHYEKKLTKNIRH